MIRAPFDGIIVSKDAQVGEMISPVSAGGGFTRTGVATIVDMNSNEIEVDVNEAYIARVEPGQPVTAVLDAYPDWQIPSKVRTVIPTADRQKATVKVRISFLKLDPRILPDMGIKVTFLGNEPETKRSAPRLPRWFLMTRCVTKTGRKSFSLVKDRTARASRRHRRQHRTAATLKFWLASRRATRSWSKGPAICMTAKRFRSRNRNSDRNNGESGWHVDATAKMAA